MGTIGEVLKAVWAATDAELTSFIQGDQLIWAFKLSRQVTVFPF